MNRDFDDNIDDIFAGYAPAAPRIVQPPAGSIILDWSEAEAEDALGPREFTEICSKCRGSGLYNGLSQHGRKCFACKGAGKFVRKTSPEQRAKARTQAVARKGRVEQQAREAFVAAHPDIAAWIEAKRPTFGFAASMFEAVGKYGHLTEGQLAACERLMAKDAARKSESEARAAGAPAVVVDRLMVAFNAAVAARLKHPKMRFDGFVASLAPVTGKNAGAVYLKSTPVKVGRLEARLARGLTGHDGVEQEAGVYLGKIVAGKLHTSRECTPAQRDAIVAAMADPTAAAVAYGRKTGTCCCCGRELENAESVRLGIGPICAEKFAL